MTMSEFASVWKEVRMTFATLKSFTSSLFFEAPGPGLRPSRQSYVNQPESLPSTPSKALRLCLDGNTLSSMKCEG